MRSVVLILTLLTSAGLIAGGYPEFVEFPEGYLKEFTHYHTTNRQNGKQLAKMYANDVAIESAKQGALADGSVIVMQIFKVKHGKDDKPLIGKDGLFQADKYAAAAIMEKRSDWDDKYPQAERAGSWGFAIYQADGKPKENNLECQVCHQPLGNQDFMFSYHHLVE